MSSRSSDAAGGYIRRRRLTGLIALIAALAILAALPLPGLAGLLPGTDPGTTATPQAPVDTALKRKLDDTVRRVAAAVEQQAAATRQAVRQASPAQTRQAEPRAQDPQTQPPLHGTNPHGQGTVAGIDLTPTSDRPTGGDPAGKDSGEDVIVGRSRGEQNADGTYHGHITIVGLLGNEVLGVDSKPGETKAGPLDAIQTGILDALCKGSGGQICVSVARADSATTPTGSTNHYSTAHATLGGTGGLDVGAAESHGNAQGDAQCQTTHDDSSVASVNAAGNAIATVAQSATDSKACKGQAPTQTNTSSVLGLGGTGVPIPAPGCANGTPDTQTGIPALLPIVCNADDNGAQASAPVGVRDALTIDTLATATSSLARTAAAGSESHAVAPPTQCADGVDNDGDGLVDAADGGCHSDGNPGNPSSYTPSDDDESGGGAGTTGAGGSGTGTGTDNGGESTGSGNGSGTPSDRSKGGGGGNGAAQCADGVDNDGDGLVDAADPGCHTDGNPRNASSYNPGDDSEMDAATKVSGTLPFTGTDVLGLALAGLVLLASGLMVRRRFGDDAS